MSLLTKQQIADILWMSWDHGHFEWNGFKWDLIEWNEKQTAQIEIDWGKAPDNVVSAVTHLAWIDEDGYMLPGYEIATFERPVTPHPHAEIMMKYAEVAARRVDPWVEFEHKCDDLDDSYWIRCGMCIGFHADYFYRHIGDAK